MTCPMRLSIGGSVEAEASSTAIQLLDKCAPTVEQGSALTNNTITAIRSCIIASASMITTSMLRDMKHGHQIENEQIIGDFLRLARKFSTAQLLTIIDCHLSSYSVHLARRAICFLSIRVDQGSDAARLRPAQSKASARVQLSPDCGNGDFCSFPCRIKLVVFHL